MVEVPPERETAIVTGKTARYPGAMFLLGAGETCPPLHSPEYDFPDNLIEIGLTIYGAIINQVLNH